MTQEVQPAGGMDPVEQSQPGLRSQSAEQPEAADLVFVGLGAAGLSVLDALTRQGIRDQRIVVVDPVNRLRDRPRDRTWCFWVRGLPPHLEPAVSASWQMADVTGPDGAAFGLDLYPYCYVMVAADDYAAVVADRVQLAVRERGWSLTHVGEVVERVVDGPSTATVVTPTTAVTGTWVFDSRTHPGAGGRTRLLQHFRGHLVRCVSDSFDPRRISLMDFCMPQPADGVAFGYCLPLDTRTALIEYTMFTRDLLTDEEYGARVADYRVKLGLPAHDDADVKTVHVEHGVIPMTDARFDPHPGRHVRQVGSAGGATRPSTGYTFAAILRQAEAIASAIAGGDPPAVPAAYPRRHEWLDAVMLAALADGHLDGARFFTDLWARNPPVRVLEFLDGTSTPRQDAAIIASSPALGMLGGVRSLLSPRRKRP